jgi:2-oxoisovalerate ferredoxin oxidoreductase alpha subunit
MTFISVEMSNGQMADDLRLAIECAKPVKLVNRLGGNLIELDQVMDAIRKAAK